MPYSLDELAKDINGILKDHGIQEGSDKVCYYVQKALMDQNFIHNNLKDRDNQNPREILYTSYETGKPKVYLMNLNSNRIRSFEDIPGMSFAPRFSPNGSKMVLSITYRGNTDIYVIAVSYTHLTLPTNREV